MKQRSPSLLPAVLCGLFLFLLLVPLCASAESADPYFSKSDYNDVVAEPADAVITLEGDHGTLSDTTRGRSGNPVVIERPVREPRRHRAERDLPHHRKLRRRHHSDP